MPLTRAQAETLLVARCGKLLAAVGLDGTTVDGTNAALTDPLAEALRSLAIAPASPAAVTTQDLAGVADASVPQLLDVAELRALETALANWTDPDQVAGQDNRQDLGRLRDSLEKTVARKSERARSLYGYGVDATASAGILTLGFQTRLP